MSLTFGKAEKKDFNRFFDGHDEWIKKEENSVIDGHIHIERGPYTLDWIQKFVDKAVEMELKEIRLLEHCYRFEDFDHKTEHWDGIDVDRIYHKYFKDSVLLAKSGIFDGIGHPDAIKLFGHKPSYSLTEYYESLAAELAKSGMYADQNSGVYRRCTDTASLGMEEELLQILKKHNVQIITSSDAHCPEDVGNKIKELQDRVMGC